MVSKVFKKIIPAILYLLLFGLPILVLAEEEYINYSAQQLETDVIDSQDCKKLKGNVIFIFHPSGMILTADEACKYDDQDLIKAHGNIKMVDKEGGIVQADMLTYYPEKKLAILENNVICRFEKSTLYTSKLIYDVVKKQSKFFIMVSYYRGK